MAAKTLWLAWGLWCYFWIVLFTAVLGSTTIALTFVDPGGNLIQQVARSWARNILRFCRVSVRVEGLEHLTPGEAYVFAANHRSYFDIFVLYAALPGKLLWVAKQSLFYIPIFGQALARIGCVPVDRSNLQSAIRTLNQAAAKVQAGASMVIFPEGTRGTTGELLPFKKGVFIMALKAGQPVVPVSISGTFFIQPRLTLAVRPGPVKVVISPPIGVQDITRKEDLMEAVRQAIAAHYDPEFPYGPRNERR
jgi:1-acyl-sn-glycerol-3-phosphate acyltransferase